MGEKNWLIRTQQKKILGPLTKNKLIEFIERGQLTADDELSSGNGYWFWVREKELLDKYIYGDVPQTFNPISEAQDVLTANSKNPNKTASISRVPTARPASERSKLAPENEVKLPEEDDLDYPDMEALMPESDDLEYPDMESLGASSLSQEAPVSRSEMVSSKKDEAPSLESASIEEEEGNVLYPSSEDLAYPDNDSDATDPMLEGLLELEQPIAVSETAQKTVSAREPEVAGAAGTDKKVVKTERLASKGKKIVRKKRRKKNSKVVQKPARNDRYLFFFVLLLGAILVTFLWYFQNVLNKPIPFLSIRSVQAQTISSLSKKKTLSTYLLSKKAILS